MNKIAQDVHEHPEVFDNASARSIIATTLEQIDRQAMGCSFLVLVVRFQCRQASET